MNALSPALDRLVSGILSADPRSIARGISLVENDHPEQAALLHALFSHTGRAYRIGITGPPGAGKSTLTNKLAKHYRSAGFRIGIIAVDPTSPFTGGALLGDRVRMTDVELDSGVFIRSMASRGSLGGLSRKATEAADILDASGCDFILLETVGVGQSELDIARAADTTAVVLVPESGDGIQAMKAGLMEIADLFILNKSDRPGADQAVLSIRMILGFRPHDDRSWMVDILKAQANEGLGVREAAERIAAHRDHLERMGQLPERRRRRLMSRVREIVEERLHAQFWSAEREAALVRALAHLEARTATPYHLAEQLLADVEER